MSLSELLAVVPPPKHPLNLASNTDIFTTEKLLGVSLPNDFRQLAMCYGAGRFLNSFVTISIVFPHDPVAFMDKIQKESAIIKGKKQQHIPIPYPIYPESNGLVCWGGDNNGNRIYWLTEGKPESWRVVTRPHEYYDAEDFQLFDMSCTSFLAQAFSGKLLVDIWTDTEEDDPISYFSFAENKVEFKVIDI